MDNEESLRKQAAVGLFHASQGASGSPTNIIQLDTPTLRVIRQPEIWTNQHVLFCSAKIDDAQIPYKPFRVLLDLKRRIGRRTDGNAIAKV